MTKNVGQTFGRHSARRTSNASSRWIQRASTALWENCRDTHNRGSSFVTRFTEILSCSRKIYPAINVLLDGSSKDGNCVQSLNDRSSRTTKPSRPGTVRSWKALSFDFLKFFQGPLASIFYFSACHQPSTQMLVFLLCGANQCQQSCQNNHAL